MADLCFLFVMIVLINPRWHTFVTHYPKTIAEFQTAIRHSFESNFPHDLVIANTKVPSPLHPLFTLLIDVHKINFCFVYLNFVNFPELHCKRTALEYADDRFVFLAQAEGFNEIAITDRSVYYRRLATILRFLIRCLFL